MHQANGTPTANLAVDFPNEAVYQVEQQESGAVVFLQPVRVATVRWDPVSQQVRANYGDPQHQEAYFGRRAVVGPVPMAER